MIVCGSDDINDLSYCVGSEINQEKEENREEEKGE
jgi:hypothetical protein